MRCSVVIPCHNGADLTRRCLESLLAQRDVEALEILLVDNASTDDTAALATLAPSIRCLRQPSNLGFAGGVNVGLRAAREPFVVVLNNDTQAASDLLAELHRVLTSDARIGAVAPVSNFVKGAALLPVRGTTDPEVRESIAAELRTGEPCGTQDVESLAGLCLMLRRETVAEIGPLDERYGLGNFEDDDWCLRLRLHGYRLVVARRAFLHHEGHATFRALGLDIANELRLRMTSFEQKWDSDPAGRATLAALRGDLAAAATAATAARTRWPDWPDADWHIGRDLQARGQHDAAAACFRALLQRCPHHSEAALELALEELRAGRFRAAGRQLQWAASNCHLAPAALASTLRQVGEFWHGRSEWQAAADAFADALAIEPENGHFANLLGSCRLELGELDAAAAAFERAIARDQPLAHTNLAICEFRRGDLAAAARHFERAAELEPASAVANRNLEHFRSLQAAASAGA